MSNESSERICPGHCGHSVAWMKNGTCVAFVGDSIASGVTECGHRCPTTAEASPWCDSCQSYHPRPSNRQHAIALGCKADAQREPELSNAEIARAIVDDWFPTERGKRPLIEAFVSALDAKDTRSRPTVEAVEIRRQAFDEARVIVRNEIARCNCSDKLQAEILAAIIATRDAAPTPSKPEIAETARGAFYWRDEFNGD